MGKKALLAATAALTLVATTTEAFTVQQPSMVASFGTKSLSTSKINKALGIYKQKTTSSSSSSNKKTQKQQQANNHAYKVKNHDNERSFWLHALENLESTPSSSSDKSLWTKIACANGPKELCAAVSRIHKDAVLVRVGDTNLDIALTVPSDIWDSTLAKDESVVSCTKESRSKHQLVTIRVAFPEGSSFDKDAETFEDELIAVIQQVRLLEATANEKLSSSESVATVAVP